MNEIHRVENITTKTNELTTNSNQFFFFFFFVCDIFDPTWSNTWWRDDFIYPFKFFALISTVIFSIALLLHFPELILISKNIEHRTKDLNLVSNSSKVFQKEKYLFTSLSNALTNEAFISFSSHFKAEQENWILTPSQNSSCRRPAEFIRLRQLIGC